MSEHPKSVADLPSLELQCFGPPTARLEGLPAPQVVLWRKHLGLLVYLALSPDRTRTRSHLHGLLWPETSDLNARHSLNQAVKLLRDQLGDSRLVSETDSLTLSSEDLSVDVLRFEELIERSPQEAVTYLRGEFLEGFLLDDAPAFEEWSTNERARLRHRAVATLVAAGEQEARAVHHANAADLARRAMAIDQFSEPAIVLLMRAAALSGDTTGALAAFREFGARLGDQTGEQPSHDLENFAERVRSMRWRQFAPIATEQVPPLIGRDKVSAEAFALAEAGIGHGARTLFITGDPGTGRTRLLTECAERLALASAVIVATRPLESDQDMPWSTLRAVLRAGLLRAPGSAATEPHSYAVLAGLESAADVGAAEVAAALSSLLRAVADEQPVGIALDDAHFSDGLSLTALGAALAEVGNTPVVLIITSLHSWDHTPRELLQLRAAVGRRLKGVALRLEAFSASETRHLVDSWSPWCKSDDERERLARRLFFETSGNPFLVVTMLRGLADAAPLRKQVLRWPAPGRTSESQWPISVPSLARRAIMARVGELDKETVRVLQAICIGSQAVDVELVAALADLPPNIVDEKLALLERRHFLTFDGERYVMAAQILADVVRGESLLPGELHMLRTRAIGQLRSRADLESRLVCAQLLTATSGGPSAVDEALAVATAALTQGSHRTARQALAAAARALNPEDKARGGALQELRNRLAQSHAV